MKGIGSLFGKGRKTDQETTSDQPASYQPVRDQAASDTLPMTEAQTDTVETESLPDEAGTLDSLDTESLPDEEEVRQALKSVYDPEIGISIVDLGLVYGVQVDDDSKNVIIDMTLTTPACPLGPIIKTQAHAVLTNRFPAVNDVDINLVWTPRWDPRIMASEEAKAELGIW